MPGKSKQLISYYARYTFLRCSEYTKSRKQAENLAIYTLTAMGVLAEDPKISIQPGELIDRLVKIIQPDIIKQLQIESEMFFSDEKMLKLATAMNKLDGLSCQVLVLYHIEDMTTKEISQIYNKSIPQIREAIISGEKELVSNLAQLWSKESALSEDDVCLWLDELAQTLGGEQKIRIIEAVENYLAEPEKGRSIVQKYLDAI